MALRHKSSAVLHRINSLTTTSYAALAAALLIALFVGTDALNHFPESWTTFFDIACGTVTVVMVFIIQHTQARQQIAIQLKLDEVLRAIPAANNQFIHVEDAPDEELEALDDQSMGLRDDALDES